MSRTRDAQIQADALPGHPAHPQTCFVCRTWTDREVSTTASRRRWYHSWRCDYPVQFVGLGFSVPCFPTEGGPESDAAWASIATKSTGPISIQPPEFRLHTFHVLSSARSRSASSALSVLMGLRAPHGADGCLSGTLLVEGVVSG